MHARMPKNFVLEERLERFADVIEVEPKRYAGRWIEACSPLGVGRAATDAGAAGVGVCDGARFAFDRVSLDLGCGKGQYLVSTAQRKPRTLFVGIDAEPVCVAYAAQHVMEAGLRNVVVVPGTGHDVARIFGAGELSSITINFPTPFPRKKEAEKRLTYLDALVAYRVPLAPEGQLVMRTDSQPLRDFTLTQLELAGYRLLWLSDDVRADHPELAHTEYEEVLTQRGAAVLGIAAMPDPERAPEPGTMPQQTAELSLAAFLPGDLESLGYVPYGMEGCVLNLRNQRLRAQARLP